MNNLGCKIHREANCIGQPINMIEQCPCCSKHLKKNKISFNFNLNEIYHIGSGLALYLKTSCMLMILLLVLSLLFSISMMIINARGQACAQLKYLKCSKMMFLNISAINAI
jgi:hypothetical protein